MRSPSLKIFFLLIAFSIAMNRIGNGQSLVGVLDEEGYIGHTDCGLSQFFFRDGKARMKRQEWHDPSREPLCARIASFPNLIARAVLSSLKKNIDLSQSNNSRKLRCVCVKLLLFCGHFISSKNYHDCIFKPRCIRISRG